MAYSYETVTIGSVAYAVYGDIPSAREYLQADISTDATNWLATDAVTQARSLVAAVRWLDQENWLGEPTDLVTPQSLQWPRTGLVDQYGQTIDQDTIPAQVVFAEFELAAALVTNPDLRAQLQDPRPAELSAGSARIRYFRPIGAAFGGQDVQTTTVFPQNVMDLIGLWLAGAGSQVIGVQSEGTCAKNELVDDYPGVIHGF